MPHTYHSLFPFPGYKTPLPLNESVFASPSKELGLSVNSCLYLVNLFCQHTNVFWYFCVKTDAQQESEKYRFLPTKGAQSGDKLEIWLNIYFSFQCYWDKTKGLDMELLSELPTLTRALNLRHVSFTSVSIQIPFAYLISPFLPTHPIKTKCWFWEQLYHITSILKAL